MKIRFEWDERKAAANLNKHQISFDLAITVFDDPSALIALDQKHSKVESREWVIGLSDKGILVVVFTKRMSGHSYRLISARKANRKEKSLYEEFKKLSL